MPMMNNVLPENLLAALYQRLKYGTIPEPGSVQVPVISQAAPQTQAQLTEAGAWTPEDAAAIGFEEGKQAQSAGIQSAIDSGNYDPTGSGLPFSATSLSDFFDKYGTVVLIAGCVGVFLVLKEMR